MQQPVLYIWHVSFADVIGQFSEPLVVYQCSEFYARDKPSIRRLHPRARSCWRLMMPDDQRPPKSVYPTEDEIAQRAYEMLQERTTAPCIVNYWKLAEAELLERAAARAVRPVPARPRRRKN